MYMYSLEKKSNKNVLDRQYLLKNILSLSLRYKFNLDESFRF